MMLSPRRAAPMIAWASLLGCVSEGRGPSDVVGADVPDSLRCDGDGDCDKFTNLCNTSSCVDGACRSEPIVCDDTNVCTNDSCDVTRGGCLFKPRDAGLPCVAGLSEACEGDTWHYGDTCDDSGHCVDAGTRDCAPVVLPKCHHGTCDPERGCIDATDEDGSSCFADVRSDVCVDAVRYDTDTCADGACVDGGESPCPGGFCDAPACDGRLCGTVPLGVDVDITGAWMLFELGESNLALGSRQTRLVLDATAGAAVTHQRGGGRTSTVSSGAYCVQTDGSLQIGLQSGGEIVRQYAGHVARGRDFAALERRDGHDGLAVMVRDDTGSTGRRLEGAYRLLGVEAMTIEGIHANQTLLGTISFSAGCVTGGNHVLARREDGYAFTPSQIGACAAGTMDDGQFELPVSSAGYARTWVGVIGPRGEFAVVQSRSLEDEIEPSLIVLVRIGLAQPFALNGVYATSRLDVDGDFGKLTTGHVDFDGTGTVTGFEEGELVWGPGDSGEVDVSTNADFLGSYFVALRVGEDQEWRVGQIGPSVSSRVDWIVDLQGASFSSPLGPIDAGGMRLGVRRP